MKLTTFKKYFLMASAIFLLCLTAIVMIVSFPISNYLAKEKYASMETTCRSLARYASSEFRSKAYQRNMYNMTRVVADTEKCLILVADRSGRIVSCTCQTFAVESECEHAGLLLPTGVSERLEQTESLTEVSRLDGLLSEMHYVAAQKMTGDIDGALIGYVVAATPSSNLSVFYADLFKLYVFAAIFPIVIMFFALYAMTYRMNKPLRLMSEAAQAMAKGDFSRRIPVTGNDEIGALSESFNQMTNSLVELENMRRGFIANVSHELKTPMTTIDGFITGIIDGTIEEDQRNHYLQLVSQEVKRLSRLVQSMLSLSKLEAGETKPNPTDFDFSNMVLDVVISQEQRIEARKLNITGLDTMEGYRLYADRDLLHQVVYNLCDNAVKFTDEGGTVHFSLERVGNMLDFRIRNTGKGISEQDLPFVFDRFYKGDRARSQVKDSTGLGLYLVKTIVKIHGGRVFVSSKENEFTEFGILLPIQHCDTV